MDRKISVNIGPEQDGLTLLDFLTNRFTYRDRTEWRQEIVTDRFYINNEDPVASKTVLKYGDRLVYLPSEIEEPEVARDFTILYEDDDLLALNKPAPLPCHPAGRYFRHTLWYLLREKYGLAKPYIINRLDRETSGVVLVAKNKKTARDCSQQFAERQVEKRYLVLVEGVFPSGPVEAKGWLGPDPDSMVRKKLAFRQNDGLPPLEKEKRVVTLFRRLRSTDELSLLEARPYTGRLHQIRATLCGLGFPVVGDKIYGIDEQFFLRFLSDNLSQVDQQKLRLNRQALHGASLTIRHPAARQKLSFSAPLPEEMAW